MPDVTRHRTGELLRKLFEILLPHAEGLQARGALELLASKVQLTDHEKGFYSNGARRFEKIVRFSTIDCLNPWGHFCPRWYPGKKRKTMIQPSR